MQGLVVRLIKNEKKKGDLIYKKKKKSQSNDGDPF